MMYPVGSGENRSLKEYVEIIRNLIDPELSIGFGELPYKTNTIDNQELDITMLKEDTGFNPKYTFEEGIMDTISFFRSHL